MNPSELRRHRDNAVAFNNAYIAYLQAGPHGDPQLRTRVVALMPDAQVALDHVGIEPVLYPAPAI